MLRIEKNNIAGVVFENGVCVVNTTPHPLNMEDSVTGELVTVPCCGLLVNGTPKTKEVSDLFVKTVFEGNDEGREVIEKINALFDGEDFRVVIVGSMIAAQAYPGQVAAMVPVPGYERVAPAEKRMRTDRFTIF